MSGFDPRPAAAALLERRRDRVPAGPLPGDIVPRDLAQAVAVQLALAELVGAVPPGGFKLGATGQRMQAYLGLTGPDAGFMRAADIHGSGTSLPYGAFRNPGVECEIAVRLARDLPPGPCDPAQARGAVGTLFAAIEIVENRYGKPPAGDLALIGTPTIVADQFYHAAAVLGAPASWAGIDLAAITGRILFDGVERANGQGRELLGHPLRALAWFAGSAVAAAFGGLRAGQVVMLGSVTPPLWLSGPATVTVRFEGFPDAIVALT